MKKNGTESRVRAFLRENRGALLVLAFLLLERLLALYALGFTYSLNSDDAKYINSGVTFAYTGMITGHGGDIPSAQIMPGMTVFIGLCSLVFGEGKLLWAALKLIWCCMGVAAAWFSYRCVNMFAPKWCGIAAMLPFFRADMVWMDNLILTETPFMLALTAMVYYTLRMGREPGWRNFWCCAGAYMAGLMLKANIAPYPVLALVYLLFVKYDRKLLLRQCGALCGVVLCFVIPWSLRNYAHFHAFIPLTCGGGNPALLGTYQGIGYPLDAELDYETNVDRVVREKYAGFYGPDGEVEPRFETYVSLMADGVKAKYRLGEWLRRDVKSVLYSYFYMKPQEMMEGIFYWGEALEQPPEWLELLQKIDLRLCVFTLCAALALKKRRGPVLFLTGVYLCNIYIYSMTFAFSRYNAPLMSLRFMVLGLGCSLLFSLMKRGMEAVRDFDRKESEKPAG